MPKILMPLGDATEALDTFYAYYRLPEDDFEVVVAGPEARLYHTVLHEIPPNRTCPGTLPRNGPAITYGPTWPFAIYEPKILPEPSFPQAVRRNTSRRVKKLSRIESTVFLSIYDTSDSRISAV